MIWIYLLMFTLCLIPVYFLEFKVYKNKLKIQEKILKLLDLDITVDEV